MVGAFPEQAVIAVDARPAGFSAHVRLPVLGLQVPAFIAGIGNWQALVEYSAEDCLLRIFGNNPHRAIDLRIIIHGNDPKPFHRLNVPYFSLIMLWVMFDDGGYLL